MFAYLGDQLVLDFFFLGLEYQIWLKKQKSINMHQVCSDFNHYSLY